MTRRQAAVGLVSALVAGCGDSGGDGSGSLSATGGFTTGASTEDASTTAEPTGASTSGSSAGSTATDPSESAGTESSGSSATGAGCAGCVEPNQACVADQCVSSCQGRAPDPCGAGEVCDVISGECKALGSDCTLAGPSEACGEMSCGPGSVCDGLGECLAIAPCGAVVCTSEGACWGDLCGCERPPSCDDPAIELINGPFSADISGIDFADDCTAWAVTLSGGQEFLRKLTPAGALDSWGGINDYDQGEVRVLRELTIPQAKARPPVTGEPPPPAMVEGLGEVALTYVCCPSCGSCANNPSARGVAHLVEDDLNMPLPIVIFAEPTQGVGPFLNMWMDAGPQGLTWGEDRVLYVGNAQGNGDWSRADLAMGTVDQLYSFEARVTAATAVSPVHIAVAVLGGQIYRFNTATKEATPVIDLMSDVTSLSHDKFSGRVYVGLADLSVVSIHPFSGEVEDFGVMPGKGRVAVSPSGDLWFTPIKYINVLPLERWPLPSSL